jgi:hypothetical protein
LLIEEAELAFFNLRVHLRMGSVEPSAVLFESVGVVNICVVTHNLEVVDIQLRDQPLLTDHLNVVQKLSIRYSKYFNDLVKARGNSLLIQNKVASVKVLHELTEHSEGDILDWHDYRSSST